MDLQEKHWQQLQPLLLGGENDPGASGRDNRLFFRAVLWVATRNAKWSALPPEFGRWQTVYVRFMRWNQACVWRQMASEQGIGGELLEMLDVIAAFGDGYTRRAAQRKINRNNRSAYNATLGKATPSRYCPSGEENAKADADANWIWRLTHK
ncbi:Mobile element protein [Collimonas arenae]|uniref:Mobile element protein n=1 Tax=Collimonas arenae TaxID=279058 RepID=A0A0A1F6M3_9BURK|nr:transposase [Collimonas arenae]AIY39314.1 Mobile element protein [Collimonas arenae]